MKTLYNQVTVHYVASSNALHDNPITAPSLWIYSEADPVTRVPDIETVIGKWRARGTPIEQKVFQASAHVEHYRKYPDEYKHAVTNFVHRLDL